MLTDDQHERLNEQLSVTLNTPGWTNVIVPSLMASVKECVRALCMNDAERKEKGGDWKNYTSDELRIEIKVTEKMLTMWGAHLEVSRFNRMRDELARNGEAVNP